MKPAADIPDRVPTALTHGCLTPAGVGNLAARLGLNETQFARVLADGGVVVGEGVACVPYAAVTAGAEDAASALFLRGRDASDRAAISILRRAEGRVSLTASDCACADAERRELHLPAQDPRAVPSDLLSGLPEPVQWQLSVLVPQMLGATEPEPSMSDADSGAGPEVDESSGGLRSAVHPLAAEESVPVGPRQLRVVLERDPAHDVERLVAVELLDETTGRRLDGAWWLPRADGPGVLVGLRGLDYERLLWQVPLDYVRKSRGVGVATLTTRRRVVATKGPSKGKRVTRSVRTTEHHIGVDLAAPKGVPVHAVGEATVAFAGKNGGYGNLIILEHGNGYRTYYAHLSVIGPQVRPGQRIVRGEEIGRVGSTGRSTGPHLHFEIRKDGRYIDPFDDGKALEFWVLSPEDQEQLLRQYWALDGGAVDSVHPMVAALCPTVPMPSPVVVGSR